jgi:hypothetical protein
MSEEIEEFENDQTSVSRFGKRQKRETLNHSGRVSKEELDEFRRVVVNAATKGNLYIDPDKLDPDYQYCWFGVTINGMPDPAYDQKELKKWKEVEEGELPGIRVVIANHRLCKRWIDFKEEEDRSLNSQVKQIRENETRPKSFSSMINRQNVGFEDLTSAKFEGANPNYRSNKRPGVY